VVSDDSSASVTLVAVVALPAVVAVVALVALPMKLVAVTEPLTSSFDVGCVDPMPILPPLSEINIVAPMPTSKPFFTLKF